MFLPFCGIAGNSLDLAPVAIIICFAKYSSVFLPFETLTFFPGRTFPCPLIISILFFFIKNCTPLLIPAATSLLRLITDLKSLSYSLILRP